MPNLFFFCSCTFGDILKNLLLNPRSERFSPMFSSKSYTALTLIFRSLIQFLYMVWAGGLTPFFYMWKNQLSQDPPVKRLHSPRSGHSARQKSTGHQWTGLVLDSVQLHWSAAIPRQVPCSFDCHSSRVSFAVGKCESSNFVALPIQSLHKCTWIWGSAFSGKKGCWKSALHLWNTG